VLRLTSLPMMWNSVIVAAAVIPLAGCSDDLETDLAACKAKMTEVFRRMETSEEKRSLPSGMHPRRRVASTRCLP
jgi:hypothetical protein